ncbi:MAG TPA: tyrosine-protein phosphatase [Anaerovoracaceae bacterium]|nr:tyrosine-protein phosphatase [Anaerovoracaceae bacterium]
MATVYPKNFRRITGQIYAGGAPDQAFLEFFKNTLGGKTVISLDADVASQIAPIIKSLGMHQVVFPLNASATSITDPVKQLVRQIKQNLFDNSQPVYIHCLHGSDRTGFAVALYRTIKQNWACDSAISEGVRWGYGNGISVTTQKLWKNLICTKGADTAMTANPTPAASTTTDTQPVKDDDITEQMRDDFELGNVPPAFVPQQSWAPDIDRASANDSRHRRRILRRKLLSDLNEDNDIPMIGQFDNYGPMRGAGPVENSGILQLI